jgi:hypothetical protein
MQLGSKRVNYRNQHTCLIHRIGTWEDPEMDDKLTFETSVLQKRLLALRLYLQEETKTISSDDC